MNIEFIKIEMQNFKSVGELVTFNYNQLNGLNFVYGKNIDTPNARNGSGKSVILVDSIVFALFGKTLKNTNNKYLPNRFINEKLKPYVKVYFKVDGQMYSCETYGRMVSKTMPTIGMELLKLDNDFNVLEDLTQSSVNKTKQYIQETLLGCSFNIFKSSIVISSADFMNFYEGMNKDQKRKYVENIFNLDCFGEMYSMIKSDLNDTKKEVTVSKNEVIKGADKIKELSEKFDGFDETMQKKRASIKEKIAEAAKKVKELQAQIDALNVVSNDELNKNKIDVKDELAKLVEDKNKFEKYKLKLELDNKHTEEMICEMNKISEGLCEKCTKLMNDRYDYTNKKTKIDDNIKILSQLEKKLTDVSDNISKRNETLDSINNKISENNKLINQHNILENNINLVKNDIKNYKALYEEVKEGTVNPFQSLLTEAKTDVMQTKERLLNFNKNMKHLEILKNACSETGVKKIIMKDIVRLLNSLIQKYLNEIGCDFIVYFDEMFDFKFLTSTGECEFSNFSAGERQRIQIATILAFRDIILNGKISSNIFIIDELLDANVDSICIENVMSILKKKATETNQNIFIISHRSELADNESIWDNIIKITKQNGQSTYEVK